MGVTRDDSIILDHLSHLGVLLLLFTVGLKLKLGNLVRREVIGGSLLPFLISSVLVLPAIMLILDSDWREAMLLAIALSFSSTVLAAKVLESKRELRAFHGRVAIGVLIIQDLIALVVMSLAAGKMPSAWALLVFLLPLLRPVLFRLLDHSGHEECPGLRRHARQTQARRRAVQLVVGDQGSVPGGLLPKDRHRRPAGRRRPLVRLRHGLAAAAQGGAVLRAVHRLPSARAAPFSAPPA